jgi:hypothetical protein
MFTKPSVTKSTLATLMPLLLVPLVACEEPDPGTDTGSNNTEAPDLSSLVWEGGCGDVLMYAGSEDRALILVAWAHQLSQQSYESGETVTLVVDLSVDDGLELVQGHDVFDLYCNDVMDDEEVHRTWTPVEGTMTFTVTSTGEATDWGEYFGNADIVLEDVVLESAGAEDVVIDSMTWSSYIGWMPG